MIYLNQVPQEVLSRIPPDWFVLDLGGAMKPLPRANYLIDILAENTERSMQMDFGGSKEYRLPFDDKSIEFIWCVQTLEDLGNPFQLMREMQRVASAGYIEIPSREWEHTMGVDSPDFPGFYHHRWYGEIVHDENNQPVFELIMKSPYVKQYGALHGEPRYRQLGFVWADTIEFKERIFLSPDETINDIRTFKNVTLHNGCLGVFNA